VKCKWLHSELDAFERVELLRDLRSGHFEALVGVNLLREGLDLPEVSMVAVLDADKEGFLRSETSLMQTIGRAARHVNAKVILYADRVTDSMRRTIEETRRRRQMQEEYNREHGITPETIRKEIRHGIEAEAAAHVRANAAVGRSDEAQYITEEYLSELEAEMLAAAEGLEFERAAALRDRIQQMRDSLGKKVDEVEITSATRQSRGGRRHGKSGGRLPRPKR
jgi:excinuclease ABC subunit B